MNISIKLLSIEDARSLYDFELENRAYFETFVPGRGEDYYIYENFLASLKDLLKEQEEGVSYFHLIINEANQIVGRMNLVDVDKEKRQGSIGYRVGKSYLGKGVASVALQLLLQEAIMEYSVNEFLASTTSNNVASQRVLEKNNFVLQSVDKKKIVWEDGVKYDFLNYIRKS
ncbi:GNAT family protein [Bacillus sp. 31A1R]|uniref:GNAT family protein n=1 Tax=Robertmurraya mangrovi TaxID=3098077 RepID=A0ABU5J186_9BACI|nr:GNAT family protein [Bacillus sp. 31A1R]MDZ5473168.1 GNAT family protein [Bacillus sp. 31A1R]